MAKHILHEYEEGLAAKRSEKNDLLEEIGKLEHVIKSLREQINGANGEISRSPAGENKSKVMGFLSGIPGNKGARMSEIVKGTGIGTSSVNFTLTNKNNSKSFIKDGKVWKLLAS